MASAFNGHSEPILSTFTLAKSCPIHFGPLKDAKSLPCGHAFCFECLKPYASGNRVACPLCNIVHRVDIYLLPAVQSPGSLGRRLIDALPPSAEEYLTKSKAATTEKALRDVESSCDMVLELLDSMKTDVKDMKSSFVQKRQSLADELKQYDQHAKSDTMTDEDKATESKNLAAICDMFNRVCTMAQDRALHGILDTARQVENVCQQVRSIGICQYFVNSDHELEADREQEIITCLASLVQRHANSIDYVSLCDSMIKQFPQKLSNEYHGTWTAVVGDGSLFWSVPFTLSVQGQTSSLKMVAYCSNQPSTKDGMLSTYKLGLRISQARFRTIAENEHKERQTSDQELISRIAQRVEEEFGGKWHCFLGKVDKFLVKTTGDRSFLLKTVCDEKEYVCWKY